MADMRIAAPVIKSFGRFGADTKGLAAIEFALTITMLTYGLLNAVDVGYYIYQRMEVENAAETGAQAAWKTCNQNTLPATQNCSGLNAAITSAIQNTSLGAAVTLASGYPEEGDYCINASSVLQCVGSLSTTAPANCSATGQQQTCSAAGNASATPGDYIQVQVTTPYQPLFGVSVMGALGWTSISMTSWMRMG